MASLIDRAGVPEQFGLILLLFALVLVIAPWLSAVDFGFLKIPTFPDRTRRALRVAGPLAFLVALGLHLPVLPPATADDSGSNHAEPDVPAPGPDGEQSSENAVPDMSLRELIVRLDELIVSRADTRGGLRQQWTSWTDDCTLVYRDRRFDPETVKQTRLDTYTIDFSNVITAEPDTYLDLPALRLRFFEGRGAALVRYTTDANAPNPIQSETRSVLIVGLLVDGTAEGVLLAREIVERCAR